MVLRRSYGVKPVSAVQTERELKMAVLGSGGVS